MRIAGIIAIVAVLIIIALTSYFIFFTDLTTGKRYYKYLYYDGAIEKFQSVLKSNPDNAEAHLYLGLSYGKKRNYRLAMQEFKWLTDKGVELKMSAQTHNEIGMIYYLSEAYLESIAEFIKATKVSSNYAEAYFNLGSAYSANSQNKEAIAAYRRVIEIEPRNVYAHWNIAITLEKENELEEAIKHWKKYIELVPGVFRNPEVERHLHDLREKLKAQKEGAVK